MRTVSEQKNLLRKILITNRKSFSTKDWRRRSGLIKNILVNSAEFKKAKAIHCFISMNNRFEVETHSLIELMLSKGKKVIVPVINTKKKTLLHSEISDLSELKTNNWGVQEPRKIIPFDTTNLDLILVPLLGADLEGNRLGYGKGFYDRFLGEVNTISIGLLFHEFILQTIPTEPFDKKLNALISEKGLFYT